jgi:DNA-binding MarR family transcriptional regulator
VANIELGVFQKDVIDAMDLPKDVVSKLVGSQVKAGLLTQKRERANSRFKRLHMTNDGTALLSKVKAVLQPPRPVKQEPEQTDRQQSFFDLTSNRQTNCPTASRNGIAPAKAQDQMLYKRACKGKMHYKTADSRLACSSSSPIRKRCA